MVASYAFFLTTFTAKCECVFVSAEKSAVCSISILKPAEKTLVSLESGTRDL